MLDIQFTRLYASFSVHVVRRNRPCSLDEIVFLLNGLFEGVCYDVVRVPVSARRYVDASGSFRWSAASTRPVWKLSTSDNRATAADDELTTHYARYNKES